MMHDSEKSRPEEIETAISAAGLRPTSNRIMVLRALRSAERPLSLGDIETQLETLDKSSVFRTLAALQEHHLVHSVEDGRGIELYEPCTGRGKCGIDDIHTHFYCICCHKVYCFDNQPTPIVPLPEGFRATSVNYMLKGLCPDCRNHTHGHTHFHND